jgi:predicted ATP-dependent endonuclease of OLD family
MYYQKFIINKYKAIKDIEVSLKDNLISIIGINEPGKTSILQAIFAFNILNDKKSGSRHLNAKNKYDTHSTGHSITAEIKFESEKEIQEF